MSLYIGIQPYIRNLLISAFRNSLIIARYSPSTSDLINSPSHLSHCLQPPKEDMFPYEKNRAFRKALLILTSQKPGNTPLFNALFIFS